MNIFSLLAQTARRYPTLGAIYRGTDPVLTYSELHSRVLRLAFRLQKDCPPGARIGVATDNCPEYVELMFAVWAAGCVLVPINFKLHPREMLQIIEDAGAQIVFASGALRDAIAAQTAAQVVTIGSADYERWIHEESCEPAQVRPEALAWLFYTSGTTGRSKGAMLSHRNVMAMTLAHLADVESIDENMSQIHAAPMSHGSGLYIPAYVARGARQVVPASGGFDPQEFLALCDEHPGCGAFLAPTMVQRIRREAESRCRRPAHLRSIIYGGGPMYLEELKKSLKTFGQVFAQIYGQGESPMTITSLRRQDHALPDDAILSSVGCARTAVEVAIIGNDGHRLPDGEIGEIVCRGDVVMAGYWNDPVATANTLRDGWLRTGDMGSLDARGYLTLRDRSKDVVISGGSNIYPREVEEALLSHPSVSEVCVVGQTDDEWGEVVVAFVVASEGSRPSAEDLDRHCFERIARFKRPKHYRLVSSLPKNSYGKVLKRELKAGLQAE